MTAKARKQTGVLTTSLTLVIAALIALIALTTGANRKAAPDPKPPVESKIAENAEMPSEPNPPVMPDKQTSETKTSSETAKPDEKLTSTAETTPVNDKSALPASAPAGNLLPDFRSPLENAVAVKGCSLTVPVFSATMEDYRVHRGIDFACTPGTPVLASANGTVKSVSRDPMMGWIVTVSHTGGAETRYAGLSEESTSIVSAGDKVLRGQVIGASGETALIESGEENHLHFEMSVDGKNVNPADYMEVVFLSDLYEG